MAHFNYKAMAITSQKENYPMATNPNSVETAEEILRNLKAQAKAAHEQKDVFLMGILTELIAVASPIVTKAIARQHREQRAKINAAHKKLRKEAFDEKKASKESPSESIPDLSDI
jgi:hypothetical protein